MNPMNNVSSLHACFMLRNFKWENIWKKIKIKTWDLRFDSIEVVYDFLEILFYIKYFISK
jgi:hypothetical protein